jgi:anti-sigma factor RsiW
MRCAQAKHKLDDYVSGDLAPEVHALVERHLAGCRECASEAKRRERIRRHLSDAGTAMPQFDGEDPQFWPEVRARIRRERFRSVGGFGRNALRAGVATAASLALIAALWLGRGPDADPSTEATDHPLATTEAVTPDPEVEEPSLKEASPVAPMLEVRPVGLGGGARRRTESFPLRQSYRVHREDDIIEF